MNNPANYGQVVKFVIGATTATNRAIVQRVDTLSSVISFLVYRGSLCAAAGEASSTRGRVHARLRRPKYSRWPNIERCISWLPVARDVVD